MSVEVRLLRADDNAGAAGAIVQAAYFRLPGYPRDDEYDVLLGDVSSRAKDSSVVVALVDGRLVGCLTYLADMHGPHGEFDDDDAASFRYFGVDPTAQGQGVGEAMVQWCLDTARSDGRRRIRIHTLESMPGAQRLYQRMGFVRDPDHDEEWDGIKGLSFVAHL
jgi:GNAT superfamily N-acetyltransferase